jgi:hypothetical protein
VRSERGDQREEHRFIVHLWRETSTSDPAWRGSVYDVSSPLGIVSGRLRDLWDFMVLRLGPVATAARETPEKEKER